VVTVVFTVPVRVTVTPAAGTRWDGESGEYGVLIVPEIVYVTGVVKFCPVTLALFTVTVLFAGMNVCPVRVGVTV